MHVAFISVIKHCKCDRENLKNLEYANMKRAEYFMYADYYIFATIWKNYTNQTVSCLQTILFWWEDIQLAVQLASDIE